MPRITMARAINPGRNTRTLYAFRKDLIVEYKGAKAVGEMGNKLRAAKEFLEYTPEYEHAWDSWPRSEHLAEDQKHHLETAAAIDRLIQAEGLVGRTDGLSVPEIVRLYNGKDGLLHALFQIAQSQDDPRAGEAAYTLGRIYMDK